MLQSILLVDNNARTCSNMNKERHGVYLTERIFGVLGSISKIDKPFTRRVFHCMDFYNRKQILWNLHERSLLTNSHILTATNFHTLEIFFYLFHLSPAAISQLQPIVTFFHKVKNTS